MMGIKVWEDEEDRKKEHRARIIGIVAGLVTALVGLGVSTTAEIKEHYWVILILAVIVGYITYGVAAPDENEN